MNELQEYLDNNAVLAEQALERYRERRKELEKFQRMHKHERSSDNVHPVARHWYTDSVVLFVTRRTCSCCGRVSTIPEPDLMVKSIKICGMPPWVFYLVLGIILSPILSITPRLKFIGWIFTSIIHEGGHTIYSLFVGCPAFPRISLLGDAATEHQQQFFFMCVLIFCCVGYGLYKIWEYPFWRYVLIVLLAFYPFLVFNIHLKGLGHNFSGHLGELLVAGIFLWRAITGMSTGGEIDRAAYGAMGWYLIIHNVYLCFGIAYIPSVSTWYSNNGSYGLVNDYIRAAESMEVDIKVVALSMMVVSIVVAPIAITLAKLGDDMDD